MVNHSDDALDTLFRALADPTRRAMIARLARGEATVRELAAPFSISAPAVSKHLRVLETAGLITRTVEGRSHRCTLDPRPLQEADAWIRRTRRFWERRLDGLAGYLDPST